MHRYRRQHGNRKSNGSSVGRARAHVFIACRNADKAKMAIDEIADSIADDTGGKLEFLSLDLANLKSVRDAANEFLAKGLPLHILVNNAGLAGSRGQTDDGFELAFGVNHLGPFLFTSLLLDLLKTSAPARIVNVASRAHYDAKELRFDRLQQKTTSFTGMPEYRCSKLANVLFSAELARRLSDTEVNCYSLHPGVVASDIWHRVPLPFRGLMKLFMITVEEGAQTSIYCATSDKCQDESGLYYDSCRTKTPSKAGQDTALAAELWRRSEEWVSETTRTDERQ
ncbi:MAG: SDR family NAD(P)-dependent oxidoreductase [Kofleriaceae bacterium]|nr:SDR family NAD(P)-dependent oxidoreductase [Kofleriaceae bacterium]